MPTTCGYHICGLDKWRGFDLVTKFGIHGFTMDLSHKCVHYSLGWIFDDVAFVPILVSLSRVRISNYRDGQTLPVLIICWGQNGGPPMVKGNQRSLIPATNRSRPVEVANRERRRQELQTDQVARAARETRGYS